MVKSERRLNPFWFPSESKVRFGLVLLAAGCVSLFAAQRGLEVLGYSPVAWIWLFLVLFLPTAWRLASQSVRVLRHHLSLTPIETDSPALTETISHLVNDRWIELNPPPQVWMTPHDISPISFGLGRSKHVILPQFLLDHYHPDERGVSPELEAVLRHELAHIKNGDLRLKSLAEVAFRFARDSLLLWLTPLFLLTTLTGEARPVVSIWEALYLSLALLGSFYLYRTALRQRELYADVRVTLGLETGKPLAQGLETVEKLLGIIWSTKTAVDSSKLPGLGLVATNFLREIPARWWQSIYRPTWLQAPFRTHPTTAERDVVLSNPNQVFQGTDRGLIFLSGFLPVLVVGLLFSLLPKEPLNAVLLDGLSYLWPRLAQLVAEGQEASRVLVASVSPGLGSTLSQTTLVDGLQAAIRLPLALWVLTLVLVGPVARGRGFSTLGVSAWFVAGVLVAQTTSLETLGLLLRPEGGGYWTILLGYGQAMIGTLSFAVMVFFYVFALRGLLRRYPSPPQFRRWLGWTTALFIGVVAWESLGAVPLGSTVEMLPYLAAPKIVKWLLILIAVAWLGLTTRRRCPACNARLTMKDEEDILSLHSCGQCNYPLYEGWTEPRPNEVAAGQVARWLAWASASTADEIVAGLRRIGRQARLSLEALQEVVAQVARDWSDKLHVRHPPQVWQELKRWVINKVRGVWSGLFLLQRSTGLARPQPLVMVTLFHGGIAISTLLILVAFFWLRGVIALIAPARLNLFYFRAEPSTATLIGVGDLTYGLFILLAMGFLTYLFLRGTWEGQTWAYAISIMLAGLLCATIVLSVVGIPLLVYLLQPEMKRHFRLESNSTTSLIVYLLTVLYTIYGILMIFGAAWFATHLLLLRDPTVNNNWRMSWIEFMGVSSNQFWNPWILTLVGGIVTPLLGSIVAFVLAYSAKHKQSWAYLIGIISVIAIAGTWLFFLPIAIVFLYFLLKSEVRRFYSIGLKRPLVVELVSTFFIVLGLSNFEWFILTLTTSIGFLYAPVGGVGEREQLFNLPLPTAIDVFSLADAAGFSLLVIMALLLCSSNFFLAWGNLNRKRWAYVLTLVALIVQLPVGFGRNLQNLMLFPEYPLSPFTWLTALWVLVPIPAIIAMLHPQIRRYFGVTPRQPLIIDLTTALHLALGLVGLIILSWAAISATALLAVTGFLSEEQFIFFPRANEPELLAAVILSLLNLGDFLVIPSFILAAAVWQGRAWAYRVSLRVIALEAATFILLGIALPILIALARPAVRHFYIKEESVTHPLIASVVFLHYLNLIFWSILALGSLLFGVIWVSSPTHVPNLGMWPSGLAIWPPEYSTQDIFWHGVVSLYRATLLVGAIALTIITVRGVKKQRSWAYLTSLGLAAYGLVGIHVSVGVERLIFNLSLSAIALPLAIILLQRPVRQYFARDPASIPPGAVSWASFLWLLLIQGVLAAPYTVLGVIMAQFIQSFGGEPLNISILSTNYVIYGTMTSLAMFAGVIGIRMAIGLWYGQRWAYLFTVVMLVLACMTIVLTIIALPFLIALLLPASRNYFADHRDRPLVVEGLTLAYVIVVGICLWFAVGSIPFEGSRNVNLITNLEFSLFIPGHWQTINIVVGLGALAGALVFSLLAVTIWQGKWWAHRVSVGLGILGSLTVIGAPCAIPVTIVLLLPKVRYFFQPEHMSSGSKEPLPETFPEDSITIRIQSVRDASEKYTSPDVDEESLMKEMRIEVVREGPPLPPIICSKCGVQNEAAESRCWKCGLNLEENRNKKKDESDTTSNVVNIITSNSPKGWNLFAIVGLGIGFIAPIGTVFAILMTATAMMLGVNEGSPFFGLLWGGSFEIAFISGVAAFGGIICLLVALIQQRKQTTLTGSRNLLVGLALIVSIFPVICCILMLVVDLPYLFDSL